MPAVWVSPVPCGYLCPINSRTASSSSSSSRNRLLWAFPAALAYQVPLLFLVDLAPHLHGFRVQRRGVRDVGWAEVIERFTVRVEVRNCTTFTSWNAPYHSWNWKSLPSMQPPRRMHLNCFSAKRVLRPDAAADDGGVTVSLPLPSCIRREGASTNPWSRSVLSSAHPAGCTSSLEGE